MCKKRKTSVTHSKTTHINKIASPRRRQWWEGRKKKLRLGHTFFVFSLPSTRGKPTSVLWMKFVWATKISKWSRCYTSVLREAVQAWSPWEKKNTTCWTGPVSRPARECHGSPLEELGGGVCVGLPARDPDPYQRLKDKKRLREISGFSLS